MSTCVRVFPRKVTRLSACNLISLRCLSLSLSLSFRYADLVEAIAEDMRTVRYNGAYSGRTDSERAGTFLVGEKGPLDAPPASAAMSASFAVSGKGRAGGKGSAVAVGAGGKPVIMPEKPRDFGGRPIDRPEVHAQGEWWARQSLKTTALDGT